MKELLPNIVNPHIYDATRLRDYFSCPRRAMYAHLYSLTRGEWEIDLEFGKAMHTGFEAMDRARIDKPDARAKWERAALAAAWEASAHFPPEGGPEWGDTKEALKAARVKGRKALLRLFPWYGEQFADDVLSIVRFTDGAPAIETPFIEPLPGGAHLVCRPDNIVQFEPFEVYVRERKSSKSPPGMYYDARYNPDIQITIQAIAGQSILSDERFKFRGVILETVHLYVDSVRFSRTHCTRTAAQIAEARREVEEKVVEVERRWEKTDFTAPMAKNEKVWPKNEAVCALCRYKSLCAADPSERQRVAHNRFTQRADPWNPLHESGNTEPGKGKK